MARLLALPVAVAAVLVPSGHALAASDNCNLGGTSSTLSLYNSNTGPRGIVTHGVGNQVTIQGTGSTWATWTFHDQFVGLVTIEDANGNCLRVQRSDQAAVANGCDPNSNYQLWSDQVGSDNQGCTFQNFLTNGMLKTDNDNDGDNVWVGSNMTGDYLKWAAF